MWDMSKFLDKSVIIIKKIGVFLPAIYTLFFAVITTVNNFGNENINIAFMIGVGGLIFQLVFFNHSIHSKIPVIDEIKSYIYKHKTIRLHSEVKAQIDKMVLEEKIVDSMTIICYGTSGFGQIIQNINMNELPITVDILVCSPESEHILYKNVDKSEIRKTINICKKNSKITVVESPIPPTIRACILYGKNKQPIWASIQIYYFEDDKDNHSFNYSKFYALVADEENYPLLKEMLKIIKSEFFRLKNFDLKLIGLNDSQIRAVRYIEEKNKKITNIEYRKINDIGITNKSNANSDLKKLVEEYKILEIAFKAKQKNKQQVEQYNLSNNWQDTVKHLKDIKLKEINHEQEKI